MTGFSAKDNHFSKQADCKILTTNVKVMGKNTWKMTFYPEELFPTLYYWHRHKTWDSISKASNGKFYNR